MFWVPRGHLVEGGLNLKDELETIVPNGYYDLVNVVLALVDECEINVLLNLIDPKESNCNPNTKSGD